MDPLTLRRAIVIATALGALAPGCVTSGPEVAHAPVDRLAPDVLYPMSEGAQWVYDVDTGGGEPPTLGIFEVTRANGNQREIANNRGMSADGHVRHAEPTTYEITSEGIRHPASGGWILRRPIEDGAEWEAVGGRTARVTDLDASIETVAGEYEHCVEITEDGAEDGRVIRTIYCPEVGPVFIESSLTTELTLREVATRARLRSYSANGDDDDF